MDVIDSQLCGYYRQHIRGVKLLHWSSRQMYQLEAGVRSKLNNMEISYTEPGHGGTFVLDLESKTSR